MLRTSESSARTSPTWPRPRASARQRSTPANSLLLLPPFALADVKGRLIAILLTTGEAHDCPVAERLVRRVKPSKRMLGRATDERHELAPCQLIELHSSRNPGRANV